MKLLGRSKSKKILIHLRRHNLGICGNYVANFSFVKARKMRMFCSELLQKQRWMNKSRTERKNRTKEKNIDGVSSCFFEHQVHHSFHFN